MEERHLTLAEIKEELEKAQKERGALLNEQTLALEHAKKFTKLTAKRSRELVKDLMELEKVSEPLAIKITDLMPRHNDDLQALFSKERMTLVKEEMEKILETVRKYE